MHTMHYCRKRGHPLVVLNITVPARMVDINVHPHQE